MPSIIFIQAVRIRSPPAKESIVTTNLSILPKLLTYFVNAASAAPRVPRTRAATSISFLLIDLDRIIKDPAKIAIAKAAEVKAEAFTKNANDFNT